MKTSTEQDYQARILRVLVYIQNHLDEAVSLDDLAEVACFSPFHFHRIFRGMVGESVMEHVRRLRLERASFELKHGKARITHVAFNAGYDTLDAFSRAFKVVFGVAPSQYRKEHHPPVAARSDALIHYDPYGEMTDFQSIQQGASLMDVDVRQVPKMKVAFARGTGPYAQGAQAAWQKLCTWAGPKGLLGPNTKFIGICHDDPEVTPPEKIRYDATIVLDREIAAEGDIGVQEIGGGLWAVAVHKGYYEKLSDLYAQCCGQWIPQNGYSVRSGPSLEIYLNDPDSTPPDELLTEVYLAVEKS
ncbi:AraC family transcriptional regulator [bacterium]|nr:AraC family transcriptional regulator [bacterium]MBU1983886.1 AraC family transcriptional regulator [bacterium]